MKKYLALLICLMMLANGSALAGGLPTLSGGGLPVIQPADTGHAGVLPDPADVLGYEGTLFAEDYAYAANYICTVYTYPLPANSNAFLTDYQAKATANGFTAESAQVDGFAALKLIYGNQYALLFPEYSGVIMLMVPNGMVFGEPLPEGNYITFTRNGRVISTGPNADVTLKKDHGMFGQDETFKIACNYQEQPISYFSLSLPAYIQEGDTYQLTKDRLEKLLCLYTDTDKYLVFWDDDFGDQLETSQDFFNLKVTRMIKESDYVLIEGTFEGVFDKGRTTIEDGSFRADMYR